MLGPPNYTLELTLSFKLALFFDMLYSIILDYVENKAGGYFLAL